MTTTCDMTNVLLRVRGEYLEMPGLCLTQAQAQRLWGLDTRACEAVLHELIDAEFLRREADGTFVRSDRDTPDR